MIINSGAKVPELSKEVNWMTPSNFIHFRECFLKGYLSAIGHKPPLPANPYSILGILSHRVWELCSKGNLPINDFDIIWDTEVKKTEDKLSNDGVNFCLLPLHSTKNYELIKERTRNICRPEIERYRPIVQHGVFKESTPYSGNEVYLEYPDKKIRGRIDKIEYLDGKFAIIDYKSGSFKSSGDIADNTRFQLLFYAKLYHLVYNIWPDELREMNHLGEQMALPFSKTECEKIVQNAVSLLSTVNSIILCSEISNEEKILRLARPKPETCRYCKYRPFCSPYRQSDKSTSGDGWPKDINGKIIQIKSMGNNQIYLQILTDTDEKINITGMNINKPLDLIQGEKISIYNLRATNSNSRYFIQKCSVVYKI